MILFSCTSSRAAVVAALSSKEFLLKLNLLRS